MALGLMSLDWQAFRNPQNGTSANLTLTAWALPVTGAPTIDSPILTLEGWAGGDLEITPCIWTPSAASGSAVRLSVAVRTCDEGDDEGRAFASAVTLLHTRAQNATVREWPTITVPAASLDGATTSPTPRIQLQFGRSTTGNTASGDLNIAALEIREA
jgi:hypothetical protein